MANEVRDSLSNRPEHIVEAAKIIGRSKLKRAVFEAIYYHKKKLKSVTEIEKLAQLSRMQVLQNGGELVRSGLANQEKTSEGICYRQIPFFQANKKKVLALVEDPSKIAKIPTKRTSAISPKNAATFVKESHRPTAKRQIRVKQVKLKIAFLSTNPIEDKPLRTDFEIRDIQQVIRKTNYRDQIRIEHVPAAKWEDLVDTLNEFEPDIVHFSGHGGGSTVLFDNNKLYEDGGTELDFALINRFIASTRNKPTLLILNACDTLLGAEIFLENVKAVIAMTNAIDDAAAIYFATRFYAAIANGQSIKHSLEQGKACLAADKFPDSDLPSLIANRDCANIQFF